MATTKNIALYSNWCQEWFQAMDTGGNSEKRGWVIWMAWAGDNKSPARNEGSDLESDGMKRELGIQIHHLESPGVKKSPLKAWLLSLKLQPWERMKGTEN